MIQNLAKENYDIEEGALYRRGMGGSMSEIVEVVEVGQDRMGIPHVRFNTHLMRGTYSSQDFEQRTLALESFCARYKERIKFDQKTKRVEAV